MFKKIEVPDLFLLFLTFFYMFLTYIPFWFPKGHISEHKVYVVPLGKIMRN